MKTAVSEEAARFFLRNHAGYMALLVVKLESEYHCFCTDRNASEGGRTFVLIDRQAADGFCNVYELIDGAWEWMDDIHIGQMIVYTYEDQAFTRENIKDIAEHMKLLQMLGYEPVLDFTPYEYDQALESVCDYALRLLEWQHPNTILDEIFKDNAEMEVVRDMINRQVGISA